MKCIRAYILTSQCIMYTSKSQCQLGLSRAIVKSTAATYPVHHQPSFEIEYRLFICNGVENSYLVADSACMIQPPNSVSNYQESEQERVTC